MDASDASDVPRAPGWLAKVVAVEEREGQVAYVRLDDIERIWAEGVDVSGVLRQLRTVFEQWEANERTVYVRKV